MLGGGKGMVEEQCRGREVAPFPLGRSRFIWEERGQGGKGDGGSITGIMYIFMFIIPIWAVCYCRTLQYLVLIIEY